MADHLAKAQEAQAKYDHSLSLPNLALYKETFEAEQAEYERCRTANNKLAKQSTIIVPVAAVATVGLLFLSKKLRKPVYNAGPPLLSLNTIYLDPDPQNTVSVGLILNINR
jgi:hypothetical protein